MTRGQAATRSKPPIATEDNVSAQIAGTARNKAHRSVQGIDLTLAKTNESTQGADALSNKTTRVYNPRRPRKEDPTVGARRRHQEQEGRVCEGHRLHTEQESRVCAGADIVKNRTDTGPLSQSELNDFSSDAIDFIHRRPDRPRFGLARTE
ncbi:hypothetical protein ON010_g13113 [Phytophthora cinnamomi]|nr:hypothetical protein ON010_g13113 [Phytophthora cinnamomi]